MGRTVLEIAAAVAPGWERWRARIEEATAPVREWMIAELEAHAGDTVLELAAGAGDTGFDAAEIVGAHGRVISTDVSPDMLMADPAAALAQTRRVLRPGGRLALVVLGAPERNPWTSILARTLVDGG